MTTKNVLFVCGFNTHPDDQNDNDLYSIFDIYFKYSPYNLYIFRYKLAEELYDVYDRLVYLLENNSYDIVITHSMGGSLIMKYLMNKNNQLTDKKIIMLMPFIYKTPLLSCLSYFSFIENLYLPKCLIIPNGNLFSIGNICNDTMWLVSIKQIYQCAADFLLSEQKIVEIINGADNIHIIYVKDEQISSIPNNVLHKIATDKITHIKGKHIAFVDIEYNVDFFKTFSKCLQEQQSNRSNRSNRSGV